MCDVQYFQHCISEGIIYFWVWSLRLAYDINIVCCDRFSSTYEMWGLQQSNSSSNIYPSCYLWPTLGTLTKCIRVLTHFSIFFFFWSHANFWCFLSPIEQLVNESVYQISAALSSVGCNFPLLNSQPRGSFLWDGLDLYNVDYCCLSFSDSLSSLKGPTREEMAMIVRSDLCGPQDRQNPPKFPFMW